MILGIMILVCNHGAMAIDDDVAASISATAANITGFAVTEDLEESQQVAPPMFPLNADTFGSQKPPSASGRKDTSFWEFYQKLGCVRDTKARACPLGFIETSKGSGLCISTDAEYVGPCGSIINILAFESPEAVTRQCAVTWPCQQCALDPISCPAGWRRRRVDDALVCEPAEYVGPCAENQARREVDFTNMNSMQRYMWSQRCSASFPCKKR